MSILTRALSLSLICPPFLALVRFVHFVVLLAFLVRYCAQMSAFPCLGTAKRISLSRARCTHGFLKLSRFELQYWFNWLSMHGMFGMFVLRICHPIGLDFEFTFVTFYDFPFKFRYFSDFGNCASFLWDEYFFFFKAGRIPVRSRSVNYFACCGFLRQFVASVWSWFSGISSEMIADYSFFWTETYTLVFSSLENSPFLSEISSPF